MRVITLAAIAALITGCATAPKTQPTTPHVFYSGVALYVNKHPVGLLVSKDRFPSCRDALADTQPILAKVAEAGDETHSAVGICVPIPIFDVADLVPESLY